MTYFKLFESEKNYLGNVENASTDHTLEKTRPIQAMNKHFNMSCVPNLIVKTPEDKLF